MVRNSLLAAFGVAAIVAAAPASAQIADNYWAGAYLAPYYGVGWGHADYTFNTDGQFNGAAGQTFTAPVSGRPIGGGLGYNWQSGNFVYGVEASFFSAIRGVSHWNLENPLVGDQEFYLKGHWFAALTGRAGYALGRFMVYGEAGGIIGHLVAEANDLDSGRTAWTFGSAPGLIVGAGVEIAVRPNISIGLGYQRIMLSDLHVDAPVLDSAGNPTGEFADHDIRYRASTVTARLIVRFGADRGLAEGETGPDLEWGGWYAGIFGGALHQVGSQLGYNFRLGDRGILGIEAQASANSCCGLTPEFNLNGHLGYLINDDLMVYGELGIGTTPGTFFDVLGGSFYTIGGGIEVALGERVSGFMEAKWLGTSDRGLIDANFQGGINFHFGR